MTTRSYSLILIFPVIVLTVLVLVLKFYLEPLEGDLTRVGALKESNYGWNTPQLVSINKTIDYAFDPDKNASYYPIVVLGDSFSTIYGKRNFVWQQLLSDYSGLDSITYHTDNVGVEDFIVSKHYIQQPPGLLIYEFVERELVNMPGLSPAYCPEIQSTVKISLPAITITEDINFGKYERPINVASSEEAMHFLFNRMSFKKKVFISDLSRRDLFSSRHSDQLLWVFRELHKFRLKDTDLEKIGCYLSYLQNRVQSNGKTKFLIMLVPDKTTVYGRYLRDAPFEIRDMISPIVRPGLNLLRLDHSLSHAAESGMKDLYLPNDTHWGFSGHDLAAKSVIDFLVH